MGKINFDTFRTEMSKEETIPVQVNHMHLRTLERMYSLEGKFDKKHPKAFAIALESYRKKNQMEKWAFCIEMLIANQCYKHVYKEVKKLQKKKDG
jgi:hypothetical protein